MSTFYKVQTGFQIVDSNGVPGTPIDGISSELTESVSKLPTDKAVYDAIEAAKRECKANFEDSEEVEIEGDGTEESPYTFDLTGKVHSSTGVDLQSEEGSDVTLFSSLDIGATANRNMDIRTGYELDAYAPSIMRVGTDGHLYVTSPNEFHYNITKFAIAQSHDASSKTVVFDGSIAENVNSHTISASGRLYADISGPVSILSGAQGTVQSAGPMTVSSTSSNTTVSSVGLTTVSGPSIALNGSPNGAININSSGISITDQNHPLTVNTSSASVNTSSTTILNAYYDSEESHYNSTLDLGSSGATLSSHGFARLNNSETNSKITVWGDGVIGIEAHNHLDLKTYEGDDILIEAGPDAGTATIRAAAEDDEGNTVYSSLSLDGYNGASLTAPAGIALSAESGIDLESTSGPIDIENSGGSDITLLSKPTNAQCEGKVLTGAYYVELDGVGNETNKSTLKLEPNTVTGTVNASGPGASMSLTAKSVQETNGTTETRTSTLTLHDTNGVTVSASYGPISLSTPGPVAVLAGPSLYLNTTALSPTNINLNGSTSTLTASAKSISLIAAVGQNDSGTASFNIGSINGTATISGSSISLIGAPNGTLSINSSGLQVILPTLPISISTTAIRLPVYNRPYDSTRTYEVMARDTTEGYIDKISMADVFAAGSPITTYGDMIYGGPSGIPESLAIGNEGQVLTVGPSGVPEWANGGGGGMVNPMTSYGDIIVGGASGEPEALASGTEGQVLTVGSSGLEWTTPGGGTNWYLGAFTSATRPSTPTEGQYGYDTTIDCVVWYIGNQWKNAAGAIV